MIVDVLLEDQRLIVSEATAPEELQSLTYINIVRVLPFVREQRDFSVDGAPVLYDQWYVRLIDSTNTFLDIPLGNIASWPGWTNDQAGYDQAEIDIYANFPATAGAGPVNSVTASAPLASSGGANPNISHLNSGVVAGAYTSANITVDAKGHITLAANGTGGVPDYSPTWTFSTNTTTNVDPGAGNFRFNNATVGSITEMAMSNVAHFDGGDQNTLPWHYGWSGVLMLKCVTNDDIIITSLYTPSVYDPYLRMSASLTQTIVGGVANATPPNGSEWRFVSVGDGIVSANATAAIDAKQSRARVLSQLFDTDVVAVTGSVDVYYITDVAGSADLTDPGTIAAGIQVTMTTDPASNFIKFSPSGTIDGAAANLSVTSGTHAQLTSIGGGNWVTTG